MGRLSVIAVSGCVLALSACSSAPKSHEVTAAYVPSTRFEHYSCDQLINEAEAIRRATPALETAVDQHRSSQTGVEVVTWVLFWPAAFALDKGTEYSQPLAQARGELQAIQAAMTSKRCGQQLAVVEVREEPASDGVITSASSGVAKGSVEVGASTRLRALQQLRDEGLITDQEYKEKRLDIIGEL